MLLAALHWLWASHRARTFSDWLVSNKVLGKGAGAGAACLAAERALFRGLTMLFSLDMAWAWACDWSGMGIE